MYWKEQQGILCSWNVQYEERRAEDDVGDVVLEKVVMALKCRVKQYEIFF